MKKEYLFLMIAFMLMITDLSLTLYYFSAYDHIISEGNPLISTQYGYLVIPINLVYLISVFIASKFYLEHKTENLDANHTFEYIKHLFHGHSSKFILVIACFGYIVSTFVSRFTVILDWIVFGIYKENFNDTFYAIFRETLPFGRYDILSGLIAFFVAIPLWFFLEYNKSKEKNELNK